MEPGGWIGMTGKEFMRTLEDMREEYLAEKYCPICKNERVACVCMEEDIEKLKQDFDKIYEKVEIDKNWMPLPPAKGE